MQENIKIPFLIRPIVAAGMLLFFLLMLIVATIGGVFAIVVGCIAFVFTGNIKVTYK
jgi:hypothetical protein